MAGFIIFAVLLGLVIMFIRNIGNETEQELEVELSKMKAEGYDFNSDDDEDEEYDRDDDDGDDYTDDGEDVCYRIIEAGSVYQDSSSGRYTPSEYNGVREVDDLKERNPNKSYRLVAFNSKTGKRIGVLYSR